MSNFWPTLSARQDDVAALHAVLLNHAVIVERWVIRSLWADLHQNWSVSHLNFDLKKIRVSFVHWSHYSLQCDSRVWKHSNGIERGGSVPSQSAHSSASSVDSTNLSREVYDCENRENGTTIEEDIGNFETYRNHLCCQDWLLLLTNGIRPSWQDFRSFIEHWVKLANVSGNAIKPPNVV